MYEEHFKTFVLNLGINSIGLASLNWGSLISLLCSRQQRTLLSSRSARISAHRFFFFSFFTSPPCQRAAPRLFLLFEPWVNCGFWQRFISLKTITNGPPGETRFLFPFVFLLLLLTLFGRSTGPPRTQTLELKSETPDVGMTSWKIETDPSLGQIFRKCSWDVMQQFGKCLT